jgi:hypothetical protein
MRVPLNLGATVIRGARARRERQMTSALAAEDIARVLAIAAPADEIAEWAVTPDAYPALTPSTEALDRVVALTADGRRVRVFVKTLHSLRHWPMIGMIPEALREAAFARFPWRVEADVYGSTLVADLPDGLRAPRIYAIDDLGDDRIRVWMEDVPAARVAWNGKRYMAAARRLGRLAGRSVREALPAGAPPLAPGLGFIFSARTAVFDIPALRSDETWRHPLMAALAGTDPGLRGDLLGLADEAPSIVDALERLPQAIAHGDACPQNLLPDPLRADGFVAIDWGFTGLAPLGYDLGQLLVGRAESGDTEAADMPAIHDAILPAYIEGLREERVDPDVDDVRRGFIGGLLLRSAFTALPLDRLPTTTNDDDVATFARRGRYARYLLDLGTGLTFEA